MSFICCISLGFLTDFLLSYRKKKLHKKTAEFLDSLRRTMGLQCVVIGGYELPKAAIPSTSTTGLRTVW